MRLAALSIKRPFAALGAALLAAGVLSAATTVVDVTPAAALNSCTIGTPDTEFSDEVASSPRHAQLWRLYQAYFLRQPDRSGLEFWVDVGRDGADLGDISKNFEDSYEFNLRYGSLQDRDFLDLVYGNVMCRTPDAEGYAYWLDRLGGGDLSRGEMMILFSESQEFSIVTGTAWALYANPYEASMSEDGYVIHDVPGGQAVTLDYERVDFSAGHERCSVASINGNWFFQPESANPTPTGFAVINGEQLPGAVDREDRGVLGERIRPSGPGGQVVLDYKGGYKINSNLAMKDGRVLESWMGWRGDYRSAIGEVSEWRWAAAGIPLITDGQIWTEFSTISLSDYTHYTYGHSFVAFDQDAGTLTFGSTTAMTSAQLISWAQASGYDDLIKFDGGGSVEFNVGGQSRVAGTPRNVPLWLGIGC